MDQYDLAISLAFLELAIILYGIIALQLSWQGIERTLFIMGAASGVIAWMARIGSGWSPSSDTIFGGLWINAIAMFALAVFLFVVDVASKCGISPRMEALMDALSDLLAPFSRFSRR